MVYYLLKEKFDLEDLYLIIKLYILIFFKNDMITRHLGPLVFNWLDI